MKKRDVRITDICILNSDRLYEIRRFIILRIHDSMYTKRRRKYITVLYILNDQNQTILLSEKLTLATRIKNEIENR